METKYPWGSGEICATIFSLKRMRNGFFFFSASNRAKSKRALSLLQLKGSCFSKQEYLDSAWEAGTALRAPCLLSAQLDTCEMLGDHRLISMCTAAFLWEERLFISLLIMDV